jgi:DNA-binding PadR family transcriptional regulator
LHFGIEVPKGRCVVNVRSNSVAKTSSALTENEGLLLALLARAGPLTAYQIAKAYDLSPVSNFNTSKGKIYPMIRKLGAAGLIEAEKVPGDARGTERLSCTPAGLEQVKRWVSNVQSAQILPEDPLRSRVQSFGLLSPEERRNWLADVRQKLTDKLRELDEYRQATETPFQELVHQNAYSTIQARLAWLDRVFYELAKSAEE